MKGSESGDRKWTLFLFFAKFHFIFIRDRKKAFCLEVVESTRKRECIRGLRVCIYIYIYIYIYRFKYHFSPQLFNLVSK